jgi:hypothetical protein
LTGHEGVVWFGTTEHHRGEAPVLTANNGGWAAANVVGSANPHTQCPG